MKHKFTGLKTITNQLRLGNWVNSVNGFAKISQIIDYGFVMFYGFNGHYSRIEGIPLTPEILEKSGFKETEGNEWYRFFSLLEFTVLIHVQKESSLVMWNETKIEHLTNNLHVHTLQNLYFSLTGEELEITPF